MAGKMITTEQFAAELAAAIDTIRPRLEIGLDKVGELTSTMAAHYLGTYQENWPSLAESTIASKTTGDSPGLETGAMRDSIQHVVDPLQLEVVVGSSDKHALWFELGTAKQPPRPFLSLAMQHAMPFAEETFGKIATTILMLER
jgi:hypothetical protein